MKPDVIRLDETPSTNLALKERLNREPSLPDGAVLTARCQTAGRGRMNRTWSSVPGRDLCVSRLVRTEADLQCIPSLSMVAALAMVDILTNLDIDAFPKWPNDVLTPNGKICGILAEHVHATPPAVILGIGINVNSTALDRAFLKRPAISIREETGHLLELDTVLKSLNAALDGPIQQWKKDGFEPFRAVWLERSGMQGRHIVIDESGRTHTGRVAGLGPYGQLQLRSADGTLREYWSGDASYVGDE